MRGKKQDDSLTKVLASFLAKRLIPDLAERARTPSVRSVLTAQWEADRTASRTADGVDAWIERVLEQVGAAWVLSCVFVRTLEDRGLLDQRRIAGPGASDAQQQFSSLLPALGTRDYLLTVFREVSRLAGADDLLGPAHNAAWRLAPSNAVADALLEVFRATDESHALRFSFATTDTRALGDLYQDLSESVRERFALLQTPDFVESFILDQTLEPALAEFGLETLRMIDPTCGSGHFLLGAFERLFEHWQRREPGVDPKEHANRAVAQVYGVDLNPYAVAIARFRLTLAYLSRAGITSMRAAPRLPVNLVVADSLLYGGRERELADAQTDPKLRAQFSAIFDLEDPVDATRVFGQRYHAVVGNPPYITCKDAVLREEYRRRYKDSAMGKYALAAPFVERFFELGFDGGFVGLINANSFMKREFGKGLIEKVLPRLDLQRVIDTSGAFIPGHGTPTVLLFGRNQRPVGEQAVRAVLGKRGEPETPDDPEHGKVWGSIAAHFDEVGFENEFVSVADVARATFGKHPWSLGGGGAADLKELIESRCEKRLGEVARSIGISCVTGEDDLYLLPADAATRRAIENTRPMVVGEQIRDWSISESELCVFPYDTSLTLLPVETLPNLFRHLWVARSVISKRRRFGVPMLERGLTWFELQELYTDKLRTPLSIAFAFVATHNHFVLDRGGKVFKQSAPIIKLPEGATEEDHLALLAYLNSSTFAFYCRQVCSSKGAQGINEGLKAEYWEQFLEYAGAPMSKAPVPNFTGGLVALAARLSALATSREDYVRAAFEEFVSRSGSVLEAQIQLAEEGDRDSLEAMVAVQEELDWYVYEVVGLFSESEAAEHSLLRAEVWPKFPFELDLGDFRRYALEPGARAFERVMTRTPEFAGSPWFARNGYSRDARRRHAPAIAALDTLRERLIGANRWLGLVERPEHKRRWQRTPVRERFKQWATDWILDRAEETARASTTLLSVAQVADQFQVRGWSHGVDLVQAFSEGNDLTSGLRLFIDEHAVPYLSALRCTDAGLAKRAQWEHTWSLQRREDAGDAVGEIPVPPKYDSKDFRAPHYWSLRGKLDVPKERFISYPGAERDDDKSPLFGWAGWNHLERARVLGALYHERKTVDGWEPTRLVPLLAGLLELVPWLKQWHNEPSEEFGGERLGDYFDRYVEEEARALGVGIDGLRAWRPETRAQTAAAARATKAAKSAAAKAVAADGMSPAKAKRGGTRRERVGSPEQTTPDEPEGAK